jgi:hypothetical protein
MKPSSNTSQLIQRGKNTVEHLPDKEEVAIWHGSQDDYQSPKIRYAESDAEETAGGGETPDRHGQQDGSESTADSRMVASRVQPINAACQPESPQIMYAESEVSGAALEGAIWKTWRTSKDEVRSDHGVFVIEVILCCLVTLILIYLLGCQHTCPMHGTSMLTTTC